MRTRGLEGRAGLQHLIPTKDRIWKIGFGVRVTAETYKQLVKYFLAPDRLRHGGLSFASR